MQDSGENVAVGKLHLSGRRRMLGRCVSDGTYHLITTVPITRWLVMVSLVHVAAGCGPGSGAGRRRGVQKLTPLVYKQHVPNVSENTIGASGAAEGRITDADRERWQKLTHNYNSDIIFKDEEGTGFDRMMSERCKEKLNNLAISVMNQWPGVKLRVIEGWDDGNMHMSGDTLHYEGRAVDVTTSDRDHAKYGMLAKLAVEAGFDWVYYETRNHIHCSVKSESSQSVKSGGCFPGSATVRTSAGPVPMSEVRVGDLIQTDHEGSFSPVLMFLDRDPEGDRQFVQIRTETGRILELTPQHLLPVFEPVPEHLTNSQRRLFEIFAADVEIGDYVKGLDGSPDKVVDVRTSHGKGVYAPLTAEGVLVVNDIVVSCYAVVHSHSLAHVVYGPLRLLHNFQLSLRRLWENSLKQITFVKLPYAKVDTGPPVGVHWYASSLYFIAENVLPSDWLFHD